MEATRGVNERSWYNAGKRIRRTGVERGELEYTPVVDLG